ncbi:chlorite dismutase family protein [Thermomicrobiaceae bacterium CFH 74404]|uniref:Chlorite dismutase family protein n=1 Tax=Thermalbibacter longus TaxID=2951981 RepID=A0AA41WIG6_9BACT|nr:chlorite dismutase family protein [Thermalbibacter longus]MCM8749961.1 chlorite dismutase family protein [Thermalbibacter longus]
MSAQPVYTVFWLYKATPRWRELPPDAQGAARERFLRVLGDTEDVRLRGAYSTIGFRADVDLILWLLADDPERLQRLAVALNRTPLGQALEMRYAYLGVAGASQYDPTHGPAFLRGVPPKRYLSVYPFIKTPEWYLLPFERRRELMIEHGRLGDEFPSVLTNTVNSFGVQDQEFIVALEDDDVATLVTMVQRLRAAEVRRYTQLDTPIFLGLRKEPEDVLADLS